MNRIITYASTENFVSRLADYMEDNYIKKGGDISKLALVFGGKRPALFLKSELAKRVKKSFFSPRFFSIDEFLEYSLLKLGPSQKVNDLDACFAVYRLARRIAPEIVKGRESFSKFLPWAKQIVSFIEQLDLEGIEPKPLENVQFKAAIGYDVPESINALLESITALRDEYHAALKKKEAYSRGLTYLTVARDIGGIDFDEFDQVFFCGFFYLHKTEKAIIKDLYERNKAVLFFHGSDKEWGVLADLAKVLGSEIRPEKEALPKYNLCLESGFDVHSEVCLVREKLKKIGKLDNTAIVMPLEDNIVPLLSEISSRVSDFNVSMGYPLSRSSLHSLFENIFMAQESKKGAAYYARDYLKVLAHPLVKNLKLFDNPAVIRVMVHKIEEALVGLEETPISGNLFVELSDIEDCRQLFERALITTRHMDVEALYDELREAVVKLHRLLFSIWEGVTDFHNFSLSLEEFLDVIARQASLSYYPLNLRMAEKISAINEQLQNSSFKDEQFPPEDIYRIFLSHLESERISFSGSPLKGLQILGLFETRSLSFENVIIMDVNENALPNLKIYEPLIPREVMIGLGLNRLEKEEEIQRYQFRRLIAGAKNVFLVYQQRDDKEKSRFIEELVWEKQKRMKSLEAFDIPQAAFAVKVLPKKMAVKKRGEVLDFLAAREYSASSVNTYLHCPLSFYFKYCIGLDEREDRLDEPQGRDIGTFIHELLADSFVRFIGTPQLIGRDFKDEFNVLLERKFNEEFSLKTKQDAFLIKEVLDFRLKAFLEMEEKRPVQEIICLEKTFRGVINLAGRDFKFKAIVDRIDRLTDGTALIIDYKTGGGDIMPQVNPGKIESAGFSRKALKNSVKSFQLPLYLYLFDAEAKFDPSGTNACLYFIKERNIEDALLKLFRKEEQISAKARLMQLYFQGLDSIMRDIMDPDVPFTAAEEDARHCEFCPFVSLCR